jgi:DNA-binding transcriptional LysR family regulator
MQQEEDGQMTKPGRAIQTPIAPGGVGWYSIGQEEIDAVTALLQQPQRLWRYHEDSITNQLEKELETKLGVKHALFVNSGTSALACCLAGLGIGPGDEVIIQAYTTSPRRRPAWKSAQCPWLLRSMSRSAWTRWMWRRKSRRIHGL